MSTNSDSTRNQRRLALLGLLRQESIRNQSDCVARLAELGFTVNQGTLSRDLRDLGVRKGPQGYEAPDAPAREESPLGHALASWLLSATPAANQLVLRTPPSGAQPLALAVDQTGLDGVVGTLAGDDTVLVICTSAAVAKQWARNLTALASAPSNSHNGTDE